jgi:hypothetical protein
MSSHESKEALEEAHRHDVLQRNASFASSPSPHRNGLVSGSPGRDSKGGSPAPRKEHMQSPQKVKSWIQKIKLIHLLILNAQDPHQSRPGRQHIAFLERHRAHVSTRRVLTFMLFPNSTNGRCCPLSGLLAPPLKKPRPSRLLPQLLLLLLLLLLLTRSLAVTHPSRHPCSLPRSTQPPPPRPTLGVHRSTIPTRQRARGGPTGA